MKTILILLLMTAPASAAWDMGNLTPRQQRAVQQVVRDWTRNYKKYPVRSGPKVRHTTPKMWVNPNVRTYTRSGGVVKPYTGGPLTILNPYVSKAEGGGGE